MLSLAVPSSDPIFYSCLSFADISCSYLLNSSIWGFPCYLSVRSSSWMFSRPWEESVSFASSLEQRRSVSNKVSSQRSPSCLPHQPWLKMLFLPFLLALGKTEIGEKETYNDRLISQLTYRGLDSFRNCNEKQIQRYQPIVEHLLWAR